MKTEYEATFENIDRNDIRDRLKKAGAELVRSEFLQKRIVFSLPSGHEIEGGWLRVRDEGDKITCSLKVVSGDKIEDQKEVQVTVSDFDTMVLLLEMMGADRKAYQESKRELWKLDGAEITIDEWPWLEPYLEVEADNEETVKSVSDKLGLPWEEALFCAIGDLYVRKYDISRDTINNDTPRIVFGEPNPFE